MVDGHEQPTLAIVDRVLVDLAVPDGMYVGRRADEGGPGEVVIQSGEEGRHRLPLPDPDSVPALEAFVSQLQTYVSQVHGRPLPACPMHPQHTLICRHGEDSLDWVCPDGGWRSPVGDYDECNWPPADPGARDVPDRVFKRIARRQITEVRELVPERRDGAWVIRIGAWPVSAALERRLRDVAAPIAIELYPRPGRWYAA
jgi:hypothetical protein